MAIDSVRSARNCIQFAYSRLIGRFGPESDVIEALVEGLNLLKGLSEEDVKPKAAPKSPATRTRKKAASGTADISGDVTTLGSSGRASRKR